MLIYWKKDVCLGIVTELGYLSVRPNNRRNTSSLVSLCIRRRRVRRVRVASHGCRRPESPEIATVLASEMFFFSDIKPRQPHQGPVNSPRMQLALGSRQAEDRSPPATPWWRAQCVCGNAHKRPVSCPVDLIAISVCIDGRRARAESVCGNAGMRLTRQGVF